MRLPSRDRIRISPSVLARRAGGASLAILLHVGEEVRVEIERIGELANTVIEEPEGFLAQ